MFHLQIFPVSNYVSYRYVQFTDSQESGTNRVIEHIVQSSSSLHYRLFIYDLCVARNDSWMS